MITIERERVRATFDPIALLWMSNDVHLAAHLNAAMRWDELTIDAPYMLGPDNTWGIDGIALKRAREVLHGSIKIIEYVAVEPEPEQKGVVV